MKNTERYRCQACFHIAKDEICLMNCCTDSKLSEAASGNVALYNNTAKSSKLTWVIFWHVCGTGTDQVVDCLCIDLAE